MSRRRVRAGSGRVLLAALVVCTLVAAVPAGVAAQETADEEAGAPDIEVRIAAQRHVDDHVEFALQVRAEGEPWSERILPPLRFFPPDAEIDQWLVSSALLAQHAGETGEITGEVELRIAARRVENDRVEFALQHRPPPAEWSERLLPAQRFFPMGTEAERWLVSSPLGVQVAGLATTPEPAGNDARDDEAPAEDARDDEAPAEDASDDGPGAVDVSDDLLDFDMIDVQTAETVNIRSLVDGETPLLFWLWSPY